MNAAYITSEYLSAFIQQALSEDIGDGDHSSLGAISEEATSRARLLVKEGGVLAGVAVAEAIFKQVDARLKLDIFLHDGNSVKKGDVAFTVEGPARSILTAERLVLNCMQRMSAIASKTKRFVDLVNGTSAQILDTRKTTPNFRLLEKWAVLIGGGKNHRIGLYDMVMLKDNHIDMAGGIEQAIRRTQDYLRSIKKSLRIEVETRSLEEVKEVMRVGGIDIIMLDNMTIDQMREAVKLIDGKYKTEASGGVTEDTVQAIAQCGVDFISVGALTHSYKSMDLSLKAF